MKLNIISTKSYAYPGQHRMQPRYISINPETAVVSVYVAANLDGVPASVYHGLKLRIDTPLGMTRKDLKDYYKTHKADIAAVIAGWSKVWDGSNWTGRLTESANEALERMHKHIDEITWDLIQG